MTKRKTGNGKTSTSASTGRTTTAKKPAAKTPRTRKKTSKIILKSTIVSIEQRQHMIAEAAYYHSMNSDNTENEMDHWLTAESEINARLNPGA